MMNNKLRSTRTARAILLTLLALVAVVAISPSRVRGADAPAAMEPAAAEFTPVAGPLWPAVGYALAQRGAALEIAVEAAAVAPRAPLPLVELGIAARRSLVLPSAAAQAFRHENRVCYVWRIPADRLVNGDADWDRLRLAFAVRWPGGPGGSDVQRERFRTADARAPHQGLPANPADWLPLSWAEYKAQRAERNERIAWEIDQPVDGKYTVVIEDTRGRRVRNLVSGQPAARGRLRVEWDGLDDEGRVAPPGEYRWRSASHPGITPRYLFSFYNNGRPPWRDGTPGCIWLSDHCDAIAAASFADRIYLAAPLAESGHAIVQVDPRGVKTAGVNLPPSIGWGTIFLAADEKFFYALTEGHSGYAPMKDLPEGRWECTRPLSLLRWDLKGRLVPYPGPANLEIVLAENRTQGSGSKRHVPLPDNLAGAALTGGKLYVSLRQENRILVVDPRTGRIVSEMKLDKPGMLAADGQSLVAFSGGALVRLNPSTGSAERLFRPALSPAMPFPPGTDDFFSAAKTARVVTGLAVSAAGEIFISDNGVDQNVKVFSAGGTLLRQIGRPGGRPLAGPWDAAGMYQPHGIAIDSLGQLWVTETDPMPRRISVWDAASGALRREFFGPARYGAPGASFDPEDATRWIGGGALWKLDFTAATATPLATLYHRTRPNQIDGELPSYLYNFCHQDGRTFLIGQRCYLSVYELLGDGRLKLWAVCGTPHDLANIARWTLPATIARALKLNHLPGRQDKQDKVVGQFHDFLSFPEETLRGLGLVLWVDKNGDGIVEPDEIELSGPGYSIAGAWGSGNATLKMRFLLGKGEQKKQFFVGTLAPQGFLPSGAPDYRLVESLAAAKPLRLPATTGRPPLTDVQATAQDGFGHLLVNASPLRAFDADGALLWTLPNRWVGVHGSHDAPLPETGVMQGALYFLGTAPLDSRGEVTVLNGNHGRFFVLTTDGLYLDEMFKDVRVTQQADAYLIGGECFGGYFGCNRADGRYYLQSGHTDYRIFRIDGLEHVRRGEGSFQVSLRQTAVAQRKLERRIAAGQPSRFVTVPQAPAGAALAADPQRWPGDWSVTWGNAARPFPYAQVKILRRGDRLHLAYRVKDPSPLVNHGSDWTLLFKTGDSVNFEFSTDPAARADRSTPAPGDRRLLIAPYRGKPLAVLYSYREPGATRPVPFSSPWRTERVDRVARLDSARIEVRREQAAYVLTAAIPLMDLGLPRRGTATLKGDFGVIYGDDAGSIDVLRSYWSNQATGLVNDVPGEIMINPRLWGTLRFEEAR
jgi:hypothetical protein